MVSGPSAGAEDVRTSGTVGCPGARRAAPGQDTCGLVPDVHRADTALSGEGRAA